MKKKKYSINVSTEKDGVECIHIKVPYWFDGEIKWKEKKNHLVFFFSIGNQNRNEETLDFFCVYLKPDYYINQFCFGYFFLSSFNFP